MNAIIFLSLTVLWQSQDLKGNIRVYCRIRPVSSTEAADNSHDSELSLDFPSAGDLLGRGLGVTVPQGQSMQVSYSFMSARLSFTFTLTEAVRVVRCSRRGTTSPLTGSSAQGQRRRMCTTSFPNWCRAPWTATRCCYAVACVHHVCSAVWFLFRFEPRRKWFLCLC